MPNEIQRLKEGSESRNVLIIDDDHELAESLGRILKVFFKECIIASDGEEAYTLFKAKHEKGESFTVVITDLELPKMGGLRFIKQIRSLSTHQPILILSAHDEAEYMAEAIRLDVEGYLIKPLAMPKLFESLEKIFSSTTKNSPIVSYDTDPVTGWKSFQELANKIQTLETHPFTLLRIRVNHLNNFFKFVGEVFANEYITELSTLLQSMSVDTRGEFYRIGNDEFCLVLEDKAIELASTIASSMISVARYFHTSEKGIVLNSSLSIGIAYGKEQILLNSKLALEKVPDLIGGGYSVYTLSDQDETSALVKSREILRMIFDALHEENIVPFFQPIRDTKSLEIFAYESIVKIRKEGKLYGPETFSSLAIDMGQVGMITRSMIRHTFELIHTLPAQKPVILTLSDFELNDESIFSYIQFWATRNNIIPSNICFHIANGVKILQNKVLFEYVQSLQKSGFKIMISDFGMGECNLPIILDLHPDFIKFHPDIVKKGLKEPYFSSVIAKTVEIIHMTNAQSIAPEITQEEELQWLKEAKIDAFEGIFAGEIFEVTRA